MIIAAREYRCLQSGATSTAAFVDFDVAWSPAQENSDTSPIKQPWNMTSRQGSSSTNNPTRKVWMGSL